MKIKINNFLNSNLFSLLTIAVCGSYLIISFFKTEIPTTLIHAWQGLALIFVLLQAYITFNGKNRKKETTEMSDEEIKIVEQLIRQKEDIKAIKKIREYTNLDLVSAKNLFEEMKKRNNL